MTAVARSDDFLEVCKSCRRRIRDCQCLHDILDPSAFVHATIRRARLVLSVEEHDELHAEGLAILHKLAGEYEPHREGYETAGRFSGWASMYLPRKLGDAWHRMHPNHVLVTQAGGGRKWEYRKGSISLEAVLADDPDRSELLASTPRRQDLRSRLQAALYEQWRREAEMVVDVGELLSEGASQADAAAMLGLTPDQVKEAVARIEPLISKLQSEEE